MTEYSSVIILFMFFVEALRVFCGIAHRGTKKAQRTTKGTELVNRLIRDF